MYMYVNLNLDLKHLINTQFQSECLWGLNLKCWEQMYFTEFLTDQVCSVFSIFEFYVIRSLETRWAMSDCLKNSFLQSLILTLCFRCESAVSINMSVNIKQAQKANVDWADWVTAGLICLTVFQSGVSALRLALSGAEPHNSSQLSTRQTENSQSVNAASLRFSFFLLSLGSSQLPGTLASPIEISTLRPSAPAWSVTSRSARRWLTAWGIVRLDPERSCLMPVAGLCINSHQISPCLSPPSQIPLRMLGYQSLSLPQSVLVLYTEQWQLMREHRSSNVLSVSQRSCPPFCSTGLLMWIRCCCWLRKVCC